jgi:hypothetical protein
MLDGMIRDALQYMAQVCFWVHTVQLGRCDEYARLLAQALQNSLQYCTVRAVLYGDHGAAWKLNVNRACRNRWP